MRCSKCGTENPVGKKFCAQCGSGLPAPCPKCGSENPHTSRFCGDCGTTLPASAFSAAPLSLESVSPTSGIRVTSNEPDASTTIEGERKTVTALFADIKGSTELIEDLDPEEARAIIDPALKLMIDAVHRYGGYIVQSTGDGIFALFGAPLAHEDHPQRALYAALRLQEATRSYSAKLVAEGGTPLEARVGVNTGEVVVRTLTTEDGHTEYTPIGHTANLASRMQMIAPTGSIAVTEHTRKLVEGSFQFMSQGATRVKGLAEPINVYEVTGLGPLRTRLQRAAGRGLTKFVGREIELGQMKHALELARKGQGQIVAGIGEPGAGKSRLFYEFKAASQSGALVLEAYSMSHGKASAYLPVTEMLHSYFDIKLEDDERKRCEKVNGKIITLDRALEDTLPYLFFLLGLSPDDDTIAEIDPPVRKRCIREAVKRVLLRESLNQPVMVIFEDLHWIDEETQALLDVLAGAIGTARVLLLVNYRPEYSHHWTNKTYYTQLRLDPLGAEGAEEMLTALIGLDPALTAVRRLISEKTQGNPFFVEETVQALFDEGALVRNGKVKLQRRLSELKIPPTVQAMLASRIDRLPTDEKDLLQTLAVIGRDLPLRLVADVVQGKSAGEIARMLDHLQIGEFIYEQPAAADIEYIFKHALTQEVAYNSLLVERRKQLHERAARAIERIYGGNLDEHLNELGRHYSRSANSAKAIEYLRRAGERAMRRSLYAEARGAFETALALMEASTDGPANATERLGMLNLLGSAFYALEGGFTGPQAEGVLKRALALLPLVNDAAQLQNTLLSHWVFNMELGDIAKGRLIIDRMEELGARSGLPALTARTHFPAAHTYFHSGEFEKAARHGEEGVRLWRPEYHDPAFWQGDPRVFGFSFRGRALATMGYVDQGVDNVRRALAIGKEEPSKFAYLVLLLDHACWLGALISDHKLFLSMLQEAQRVADEIEYAERDLVESYAAWPRAVASGAYQDGIAALEGLIAIEQGLEKGRRDLIYPHYHLVQLADLCVRAQVPGRGLAAVEEALSFAESSGARYNLAELWRLRGELLLLPETRHEAEAVGAMERAIEIARKQQAKLLELRATVSLARLLMNQNRRDEARAMLAEIYNWFTEGFDTADLKEAKALLEELK
jgi:class 3 adenylate cyclase